MLSLCRGGLVGGDDSSFRGELADPELGADSGNSSSWDCAQARALLSKKRIMSGHPFGRGGGAGGRGGGGGGRPLPRGPVGYS
eukprot:2629611-Rhodomonas_salina.1